jgi:hypothetical protein
VYRQAAAVVDVLAREGTGQAAFADMEREFLEATEGGEKGVDL